MSQTWSGAPSSLRRGRDLTPQWRTVGPADGGRSDSHSADRLPSGPSGRRVAPVRAAVPPARHAAAGDPDHHHRGDPAGGGRDAARALQDPASRRHARRAGRRSRHDRADRLPADPAVRRPDRAVRRRRAGHRHEPRGDVRGPHGPGLGRGRRSGRAVRGADHRRPGPAHRPDHVDRPEHRGHRRGAPPDPDHRLLHGGAPRRRSSTGWSVSCRRIGVPIFGTCSTGCAPPGSAGWRASRSTCS